MPMLASTRQAVFRSRISTEAQIDVDNKSIEIKLTHDLLFSGLGASWNSSSFFVRA